MDVEEHIGWIRHTLRCEEVNINLYCFLQVSSSHLVFMFSVVCTSILSGCCIHPFSKVTSTRSFCLFSTRMIFPWRLFGNIHSLPGIFSFSTLIRSVLQPFNVESGNLKKGMEVIPILELYVWNCFLDDEFSELHVSQWVRMIATPISTRSTPTIPLFRPPSPLPWVLIF